MVKINYSKLSKINDSINSDNFYDILNDVRDYAHTIGAEEYLTVLDGNEFKIKTDVEDVLGNKLLSYVEENYADKDNLKYSIATFPREDGTKFREGYFSSKVVLPEKEVTSTNSIREVRYTNGKVRSFVNDTDRCAEISYNGKWIDFLVDAPTMNEAIDFLKSRGGKFVKEVYIDNSVYTSWPESQKMNEREYTRFYEEFFNS